MIEKRHKDVLKRAVNFERENPEVWWLWSDVLATPQELMRLVREGHIETQDHSARRRVYRLTAEGRAIITPDGGASEDSGASPGATQPA